MLFAIAWDGANLVAVGSGSTVALSRQGEVWNSFKTGLGGSFYGLSKVGADWVAVGALGAVSLSRDGISWRRVETPTIGLLSGVAGVGRRIVVVGPVGALWSDNGGMSWEWSTGEIPEEGYWNLVIDRDGAVAVGPYGELAESDDGRHWTEIRRGTPAWFNDIASDGTIAVAVGGADSDYALVDGPPSRIVVFSKDGSFQDIGSPGDAQLNGVARGVSVWVAVGHDSTLLWSEDGLRWNQGTSDLPGARGLVDVAWTGRQFVAVGTSATIVTSPDGRAWTTRDSNDTRILRGVASNGQLSVVVGDQSVVLTSLDGEHWERQRLPVSAMLRSVAWTGQSFVAVGLGGAIFTSPDGLVWNRQSSDLKETLRGVFSSNEDIVAVGNWGTIMRSRRGLSWASETLELPRHFTQSSVLGSTQFTIGWNGVVLTRECSRQSTIAGQAVR